MNGRSADGGSTLSLARQLGLLIRVVFSSRVGRVLGILLAAIVLVIVATAYGQIRLNRWNQPFYDALSRRDLHDFLYQLGVFFIIASALLVMNVVQRWLSETLQVRLREGLVSSLIDDWMRPGRAFELANTGTMGVNPDQRLHEDARKLCELSADLTIGLLQASILFGCFAGVLWSLSSDFTFRLGNHDYVIHGIMLWAAILYASIGSILSYRVGRGLVNSNADRYAREADLRFSLVRVNEHVDDITLAEGEADEKRRLDLDLREVLAATQRIVLGHTNLTWVTAGFGWVTQVAPILVAAPLYFNGKVSFGGLMMAAGAFTQAQSSLRWFIDNFSSIADWRATLLRVASFRFALAAHDESRGSESRIGYGEGEAGSIRIESLRISAPRTVDMLLEEHVRLESGARAVVLCAAGTDPTQLFRALAALWPWGAGQIIRPKGEQIFYLPRGMPYFPRGTLREVMAYPLKAESFGTDVFSQALTRFRLGRLAPMLNESPRWDRLLTHDELMSLAFARILVQRPPWVLIDGSWGSLDEYVRALVMDVFSKDLRQTGVIHIGEAAPVGALFSTTLHLVKASVAAAAS